MTVSVNLSARQLERRRPRPIAGRGHSRAVGHDPEALCLEIAEGALGRRPGAGDASNCAALKELGIRLAIDDFGTGTSSSITLSELPVDIAQDRHERFVSRLGRDDAERDSSSALWWSSATRSG